jgi:hypothetical protein
MPISRRRFESNPVRSSYRVFVQTMPQIAYHAIHMQRSVGTELDFQEHFTFQSEVVC